MGKTTLKRIEDSIALGNIIVQEFEKVPDHEVDIHDDSLRDGEQTVGVAFSPERKLEFAKRLVDVGFRHISIGFPAVSEKEREICRAIVGLGDSSRFSCLSRALKSDIEAVISVGVETVGLFLATSDSHLNHKLKMSEDQAYERVVDQIRLAKSFGLRVRFAFEDASRTDLERLKRFAGGAVEAGAYLIVIADTSGVLTPLSAYGLIKTIVETTGGAHVAAHFHNDLGMATANSMAAVSAGARLVQGTIHGIGERAGNTCLAQFATAARMKFGLDLGVDLEKLMHLARDVASWTQFPIPPNQPILGENVFSHESGIHVHGIMQDLATYEPFPPELIGREHEVRYGKHSGISSIKYAAEIRGLEPSDEALSRALHQVKERGDRGIPSSEDEVISYLANPES